MIVVDAPLLIYAHSQELPQYQAAERWFADALQDTETVGLPWASLLAFLRIITDRRVFRRPFTMREASDAVSTWLSFPAALPLYPTDRHWTILRRMLEHGQVTPRLVNDAHVAALALEHGATLYTTDRDFARFPDVRFVNPLA
jgi:hypothetical protein